MRVERPRLDVALVVEEHVARRRIRRDFARVDEHVACRRSRDAAGRTRRRPVPSCWARRPRAPRSRRPPHRTHCRPARGSPSRPRSRADAPLAIAALPRAPSAAADAAARTASTRTDQQRYEAGSHARTCGLGISGLPRPGASCRASATSGCTNSLTSPPKLAISRTSVEEMKLNCSVGVRNTSRPGRQMPAHGRELELELEIRHGAQAAHDHVQTVLGARNRP